MVIRWRHAEDIYRCDFVCVLSSEYVCRLWSIVNERHILVTLLIKNDILLLYTLLVFNRYSYHCVSIAFVFNKAYSTIHIHLVSSLGHYSELDKVSLYYDISVPYTHSNTGSIKFFLWEKRLLLAPWTYVTHLSSTVYTGIRPVDFLAARLCRLSG